MSLDSSAFLTFRLTDSTHPTAPNSDPAVRATQYRQYSAEDLEAAVKSGLNPSEAASQFGVPRETINRHRQQQQERADNRRYFQAEHEEYLVAWIAAAWKAGFPPTPECVLQKAVAMLHKLGEEPAGSMRHWLHDFSERHSDKLKRISVQYRHKDADKGLSKQSLDDFYDRLYYYITKYKLTDKDIWNMDETGSESLGGEGKVYAPKSAKNAKMKATKDRQHMTICGTIRADGVCIPPLSIVKGKWNTVPRVWRFEGAPEGTRIAFTRESAVCMHSNSFDSVL